MTLSEYMHENGLTHERFAEQLGGVSVSGLRKWVAGERMPRRDQLARIAEITSGQVMPNDFVFEPHVEVAQ